MLESHKGQNSCETPNSEPHAKVCDKSTMIICCRSRRSFIQWRRISLPLQFAEVTVCCCHLQRRCDILQRLFVFFWKEQMWKQRGKDVQKEKWSGLLERYCLLFAESWRSRLWSKSAWRTLVGGLFVCLPEASEDSRIGSEFLLQIWGGFASATASFCGVKP